MQLCGVVSAFFFTSSVFNEKREEREKPNKEGRGGSHARPPRCFFLHACLKTKPKHTHAPRLSHAVAASSRRPALATGSTTLTVSSMPAPHRSGSTK